MDQKRMTARAGEMSNSFTRRSSRRFTTLEGWKEIGDGLYLAAGNAVLSITPNPAYDPEWHIQDDEHIGATTGATVDDYSFDYKTAKGDELVHGQTGLWPYGGTAERSSSTTHLATVYAQQNHNKTDSFVENGAKIAKNGHPIGEGERPFHSFTKKQKWVIIIVIGVAGLFSGLSSNIYFPSMDKIAQDLHVSLAEVSLTITSYLIIQGLSPLFWGPLSDTIGRRPIYLYSFSVYIAANIVLSFSPNFPILLIFRGLQSAGSASTVSIGNGVIQDIATPLEKGAFISFYQAIRNFSIAVGPVLGGLLAHFFGFRSIFIFLVIASSILLIVILLFLPETLRSIAGDGTWALSGIHQPLIRRFAKSSSSTQQVFRTPRPPIGLNTFLKPLKLLQEKDILASLVFGGTIYTIWSMVVASTVNLFKDRFQLDELKLGLVFLPNGLGTIIGSAIAGKLMTRDFVNYEKFYLDKNPGAIPPSKNRKDLPLDFPIERARLRHIPWISSLFALATAVYGFTVLPVTQLPFATSSAWIAVPLLLQLIIAATSNAVFAINTTLVADLCPGQGASATAINNLVRCSMGALGVGFIDALINAFGAGAAFLVLGLLTVTMGILVAIEWVWGMHWRAQRALRNPVEVKDLKVVGT